MAKKEEEKTPKEPPTPEEEAKASKKKKLIIFGVIGLLVVGGGAFAALKILGGGKSKEVKADAGAHGEGEHEGGETTASTEGGHGEASGKEHGEASGHGDKKEDHAKKEEDHGKKDDGHGDKKKEEDHGKKDDGHGDKKKEEDHGKKKDEGHGDKKADAEGAESSRYEGIGLMYDFKPFHLNLGNPLENRYVRIEIRLEYPNEEQKTELTARDSQLRDAIVSIISRKTREHLLSPDGKDQLRLEIKNRVNQYLDKKVTNVYITDILIE